MTTTETEVHPQCPYCDRFASDMREIDDAIIMYGGELAPKRERGEAREQWVREEEGTYNAETGEFACDSCYISLGMPSSPMGWKAGDPIG